MSQRDIIITSKNYDYLDQTKLSQLTLIKLKLKLYKINKSSIVIANQLLKLHLNYSCLLLTKRNIINNIRTAYNGL